MCFTLLFYSVKTRQLNILLLLLLLNFIKSVNVFSSYKLIGDTKAPKIGDTKAPWGS